MNLSDIFIYSYVLAEFIACRALVGKSLGIRSQLEAREGDGCITLRSILGKQVERAEGEWTWLRIVCNGWSFGISSVEPSGAVALLLDIVCSNLSKKI
jgi:hypothetical protein